MDGSYDPILVGRDSHVKSGLGPSSLTLCSLPTCFPAISTRWFSPRFRFSAPIPREQTGATDGARLTTRHASSSPIPGPVKVSTGFTNCLTEGRLASRTCRVEGNIGAGHNSLLTTLNVLVPGDCGHRHLKETGFDTTGKSCPPQNCQKRSGGSTDGESVGSKS